MAVGPLYVCALRAIAVRTKSSCALMRKSASTADLIRRAWSMRYVARRTPNPSGPTTSYILITTFSVSDNSVNGSWYFSRNFR